MKVKCINAKNAAGITEGKEYSVKRVNPDNKNGLIEVTDDNGRRTIYTTNRFEPVKGSLNSPQPASPPEPVEVLDMQKLSNQLETSTAYIRKEAGNVVKSFCKIGFKLWEIRENKLYLGQDYKNVAEYAEKVLGFKKSSTANYISICERFSERKNDKPTAKLAADYANFSYTQLSLMLPLPDEKLAEITPDATCKDIRDLKNSAENDSDGSEDGTGNNSGKSSARTKWDNVFERVVDDDAVVAIGKLLGDLRGLNVRIFVEESA